MPRKPRTLNINQPDMSITEIAAFCNIKRSNVRDMLARYGVEPRSELMIGPVYDAEVIKAMQELRLRDEAAREADELRRRAALRAAH